MVIQGRRLDESDMGLIRGLLDAHPEWNRTRLSWELCARRDWRNAQGRPKDMAARTLLLKLERAGHIRLPPRRGPSLNGFRNRRPPVVSVEKMPVKDVYLYPLVANFREALCDPPAPEPKGRAGR